MIYKGVKVVEKYLIHEANIERLEKKLKTIANKCAKYGCSFSYSKGEEVFKEVEDNSGNKHLVKFIEVLVEGTAIVNGWRFVATLDHKHEIGENVVRQFDYTLEVPERYRHTDCLCEHCNTRRSRKNLYLIYNDETKEFKQVGASCIKDFTCGLDAEGVAQYISYFDEVIKGEQIIGSGWYKSYYRTDMVLQYAAEVIHYFGFVPTSSCGVTTRDRVWKFGGYFGDMPCRLLRDEKEEIEEFLKANDFNINSSDNLDLVQKAKQWVLDSDSTSGYILNLKTLCKLDYVTSKYFGLLVSLIKAYQRDQELQAEQARRNSIYAEKHKVDMKSEHVGVIGQKLTVAVETASLETSFETQFGVTYLYRFVDNDGNIFKWFTSNFLECEKIATVTGTVKKHNVYKNVKETVLTRCKVKDKTEQPNPSATCQREDFLTCLDLLYTDTKVGGLVLA